MDENNRKVLDDLANEIRRADLPEAKKNEILKNFLRLSEQKTNLMITGATGCGKSSTINALFGMEKAKVGVGVDPETMDIQRYDLENLILWDSPGLGDGREADERHTRNIVSKLTEKDANGNLLIDLVLVILDGSTRDLGTSYDLITKVIIPNLGPNQKNRILVAINQADAAMKGKHWDEENSMPDEKLVEFLDEKAASVHRRIKEATGVDIEAIYYSAGYMEDGVQAKPYNLSKLLYYIIRYTPKEKRLAFVGNINQHEENFASDDGRANYRKSLLQEMGETIEECAQGGADIGGEIGSIFHAETIGRAVGGLVGTAVGAVKAVGDWIFGSSIRTSSGGGGCYITTAVCEEYGKPDDCYELTMFRSFRDQWLLRQPDGPALVRWYYDTAPALVEKINRQENRKEIYRGLNEEYLSKCLTYIETGDYDSCKALYTAMMDHLFREEHTWPQ